MKNKVYDVFQFSNSNRIKKTLILPMKNKTNFTTQWTACVNMEMPILTGFYRPETAVAAFPAVSPFSVFRAPFDPFGELRYSSRTTLLSNYTRYTFFGKERDSESGYSYFGARYYDSDISIWLSVDPMAGNTPGVFPYAYCINNLIRLIDPDGQDWYENESGKVVWDDNITKKSGAPKGGTYIGANDKDIVKHYGFNQDRQSEKTNTKGMVLMGEEGYHGIQAETTTELSTTAITGNDKNAISSSNSQGKVFKGFNITADITTLTSGSSEGDFQITGSLSVEYGNKTYSKGFAPDKKASIGIPGANYQTASIILSTSQLNRNKSVGTITSTGAYGVKGFDQQYRPMVTHALLPFPRSFKHKF
jgi:RHS repeat-associated protein